MGHWQVYMVQRSKIHVVQIKDHALKRCNTEPFYPHIARVHPPRSKACMTSRIRNLRPGFREVPEVTDRAGSPQKQRKTGSSNRGKQWPAHPGSMEVTGRGRYGSDDLGKGMMESRGNRWAQRGNGKRGEEQKGGEEPSAQRFLDRV